MFSDSASRPVIVIDYSKQTTHKHEALARCWADVIDGGPTSGQCLIYITGKMMYSRPRQMRDHTPVHIKNAQQDRIFSAISLRQF